MKKIVRLMVLIAVVLVFPVKAGTKRPYLAGFTVIEDLSSQQQFFSNVTSVPLRGPKVDELEMSLKESLVTVCSISSPQTNRLSAAFSLVSNFATLEKTLRQTSNFTNILVFPPQGLLAPLGGDPAQATDAYQSNLLATYYGARGAALANQKLLERLGKLRASYKSQALRCIEEFSHGTEFSNQFRAFVLLSATNDFAISLSNRLYAP
jgi:hypothetical protein